MKRAWDRAYHYSEKRQLYYKEHTEQIKARMHLYYLAHKDSWKKMRQKWNSSPEGKQYRATYPKTPNGKIICANGARKYRQTIKGKLKIKRHHIKRRGLGHIFLNEYFSGSAAHHMDKDHVVFIPEPLHKSVSHNVWTGRNMDKINKLCIPFLK